MPPIVIFLPQTMDEQHIYLCNIGSNFLFKTLIILDIPKQTSPNLHAYNPTTYNITYNMYINNL